MNRGCEEWSKDDKVVNCRDLEDAMARANRCVIDVERLEDAVHVQTTEERLSRLDDRQRKAIASVLRYLADVWRMKEADEILRTWRTA